MYNLETDSQEQQNQIDIEKIIAKRMLDQIDKYISKTSGLPDDFKSPNLTETDLKNLRALGYLGN